MESVQPVRMIGPRQATRRAQPGRGRRPPLRLILSSSILVLLAALLLPAPIAVGSTPQELSWNPPWTGSIGSSITLEATASSDLAVTFSTSTSTVCSLSGVTVSFNAIGVCTVTARQAGNSTWAPVQRSADIASARPYRASATASHNGVPRTDGAIQVGDVLTVRISAADTTVVSCGLTVRTTGGGLMRSSGIVAEDGSCGLMTVIPSITDWTDRLTEAGVRRINDVCVDFINAGFADGSYSSSNDPQTRRVMEVSDRLQPGGAACGEGNAPQEPEVLDFAFDGSGTPQPFSSEPHMLSWNILDWDPSYVPIEFNTDWSLAFPSWVSTCEPPFMSGSWDTTIQLGSGSSTGCRNWDIHLPGMLPASMPIIDLDPRWPATMDLRFTDAAEGTSGGTLIPIHIPYAPSDGQFASSFAGIFPTDIAASRYLTIGDTWRPSFQISGAVPGACRMTLYDGNTAPTDYPGTLDANDVCAFSIPGIDTQDAFFQYYVTFTPTTDTGAGTFGGTIQTIPAPTAPTIPNPTMDASGTTFVADSTSSNGMSLQVSAAAPLGPTGSASIGTASTTLCSGTAVTTDLQYGGSVPRAHAPCGYVPGTYTITARLVDATGKVVTRTRTITLYPDTSRPTTGAPVAHQRVTAALSGSSLPLRLSWSATDTGGAGIGHYQVARSFDGGQTWTTLTSTLTTHTYYTSVAPSGTVRYRVRAIDRAGNVGYWSYGATTSPRLVQQTSTAVHYGGNWGTTTATAYSGGSTRYATAAGAYATLTVTARSVALISTMAATRGRVKIYVDGLYVATVDCYSATTRYRVLVWERTWSTKATHTIKVVVVGTLGRPRFDLDAFGVLF